MGGSTIAAVSVILQSNVLVRRIISATLSGDVAADARHKLELWMDQLQQVKDLLSEPKQRIELHDFVADLTRKLVPEVGQDRLPVQGPSNGDSFIARLQKYEEIISAVLPLQMLLGRWGLPEHAESAALPVRRLAGSITVTGGNTYLIEARWYPIFLLLYAASIGAISGGNYQMLRPLFQAAVPTPDGRKNRDVLLIAAFNAMGEIHDGFKFYPGLERKHTPRSEHLYSLLEPFADNTLYLGADYEDIFDRAEIMMAIEYMHIQHPEPVGQEERPWGPVGRFAWKTFPNPLGRTIAEASAAGERWEPARSGLFGGSAARFVELAEGLSRKLSQFGW